MVALAMSCAVAAHTIAQTPAPQEYQVKAVYLFNFTQFVDWPPSTFSDAREPIIIGVLGDDPFGNYLDDTVRGEKVDNRSLVVRRYRRAEDIQACQVLFISRSEGMRIEHIVATLKDRSILTVSDADDFGKRGGMVRFVVDNSRDQATDQRGGSQGGRADDQLEAASGGRDRYQRRGKSMITFKDAPIRRKLVMSILLTSVVIMLLMQAAFFTYDFIGLRNATLRQLSTLGEITAANSTAALAFENRTDAEEILAALNAERHIVAAAIYDQNGKLFAYYPPSLPADAFPPTPGISGYRFGESYLAGFQPMVERDRRLGTVYLKFDTGIVMRQWLWDSLRIALAVMALVLMVAYLLSRALQKQISRPILALAETAKDISDRRDFSIRAKKHGQDEIGQLTDGFNEMLAGIEEREYALNAANDALRAEIAERNMAQRQLARAQKMEAVGQLTGGLAHDFNNILGAIIGNLDIASEQIARDSPAYGHCDAALDAALSAAELVKRLLAFSRRQPLRPQPTNLAEVIANVLPLLERTLGEHIRVTTASNPHAWLAMADPDQIESAILNLAINARDAMPSGGVLRIEQHDIAVDEAYTLAVEDLKIGDYVLLTINDTGSGMRPEIVARAFDPFFTTKAPGAGSGLGLSMVFGTMKQLGGTARIYSEVGLGTTVMLYMPRAPDAEVEGKDAKQSSEPVRGGSERILMVEDNAQVRTVGAQMLRSLGYQVIVAENGDEAMRYVENGEQFDLLFSDVVMSGGLNGVALAHELRRRRPGLPILLTSGFTSPATASSERAELGAELITKPYRKADLAARLRTLLEQQSNSEM